MKTVLDVLQENLTDMIDARSEVIAFGEVDDFSTYKYLAGVISGLTMARETLKDLRKYHEEDM